MPVEPLAAWLTAAFPGQPGWVLKDRQAIGSFQQRMERVTLHWPDTNATAEVFVRRYRGYMSWWTLETPDLPRRERTACRVASRAGVPVPKILHTFESPEEAVTVLRREPGDSNWTPPTPEMAADLAETLARLHAAPVADEDRAHLPDVSLAALLPRFARWAEEAENAPLRGDVDALAERFTGVAERPVGLIHGDFHPGNVLSDGRRVTAVIDWEEAALGDPRIDVALMEAMLRRHSADLAGHFLRRYQERAGYPLGPLPLWMDLTDLRSQIVSAWVKHALAHGRSLPTDNPEVWLE